MKKKIFIAEDNKNSKALFEAVLRLIPEVELITERNGKEALEKIKHIKPDIIIMDIKLPEISGIEICKQLKSMKEFQEIKILAVTAVAMPEEKGKILRAGFDEYITKPIKIKEFRKIIKQYLNS